MQYNVLKLIRKEKVEDKEIVSVIGTFASKPSELYESQKYFDALKTLIRLDRTYSENPVEFEFVAIDMEEVYLKNLNEVVSGKEISCVENGINTFIAYYARQLNERENIGPNDHLTYIGQFGVGDGKVFYFLNKGMDYKETFKLEASLKEKNNKNNNKRKK